jgi:SAM-dependent methyltransferase
MTTDRTMLDQLAKNFLPHWVKPETRRVVKTEIVKHCKTLVYTNLNEIIEYSRVVGFDLKKTVRLPRYIYLAPKLDGQMSFVYWNADGLAFHIRDTYMRTIPKSSSKALSQSLMVAELVGQTYYVVDLLMITGRYMADDEFDKRLAAIPTVENMPPDFLPQTYIKCGWENRRENILSWKDGLAAVDVVVADHNATGVPTDGIIMQPPRTPYYTMMVQKWKPPQEQTADALLDGTSAWLHSHGKLLKQPVKLYKLSNPLTVGECLVVDNQLQPTGKLRPDKYRPNGLQSIKQNPILSQRDVLEGRTGHLMKFYNRGAQDWTLWPMVHKNSTILDIGAGKGRSSDWWQRLRLKVYAVEPDSTNYAVLVQRARPHHHMQIGGEDKKLQTLVPNSACDVVMMSFSISFFFQNPAIMQKLLDNICWALKPGGVLLGLGLDGTCVLDALARNNDEIDCEAFSIHSIGKKLKPSTYGCEISINMKHEGSLVKDQIEYLAMWDEWVNVLQKRDIELVKTDFLQGHWSLSKWPLWFTKSSRWWAFRKKI